MARLAITAPLAAAAGSGNRRWFARQESAAELEAFLINFVVEQTGYPAEVVDLDADLEADLGIDSIKKAQLFGELQEYFDVGALAGSAERAERCRSTTSPRCGTCSNFLVKASPTPAAAQRPRIGQRPVDPPAVARRQPAPAAAAAAVAAACRPMKPPCRSRARHAIPPSWKRFLINFVVEQTGYPAEVVDLDADLEADLGIDSIKKAQLFGELQEYFDVSALGRRRGEREPVARRLSRRCGTCSTFWCKPRRRSRRRTSASCRRPTPQRQPTGYAAARRHRPRRHRPAASRNAAAPAAEPRAAPGQQTRPSWKLPDQLRGRADRLSGRSRRPGCRSGSRPGHRQHQEGPALRRAARVFRRQCPGRQCRRAERLSLDDFTTLRHVLDFLVQSQAGAASRRASNRLLPRLIRRRPWQLFTPNQRRPPRRTRTRPAMPTRLRR